MMRIIVLFFVLFMITLVCVNCHTFVSTSSSSSDSSVHADMLPPSSPTTEQEHMDSKEVVHAPMLPPNAQSLYVQRTQSVVNRWAHYAQKHAHMQSNKKHVYSMATFKSPAGYVCPTSGSESVLLAALPNADYNCVLSLTGLIARVVSGTGINTLVSQGSSQSVGWSRRNAIRVLGDLCWTYSTTGSGCTLMKGTYFSSVQSMLANRINSETDDDAMNDAIWVFTTYYLPYDSLQSRLMTIALSSSFTAPTRFRAITTAGGMIVARSSYSTNDMNDLLNGLRASEPSVRSEAAYLIGTLTKTKIPNLSTITTALNSQANVETDVAAKVFMYQAMDTFTGTNLVSTFRTQYERTHLSSFATRYNLNITSGLPTEQLGCYLTLMNRERNAFFNEMGSGFTTPIVSAASFPSMNLIVFASKQEYIDYMGAFIRFGVYAGGLFMQQYHTLFTFQRTSKDSIISLNELILHEFGHYLHSRHVFQNYWVSNDFFTQPLGYIDEGTAEYWATLNFNEKGCYSRPIRSNYLSANCPATTAPTPIQTLINMRTGYDQSGVFDYQGGYFFIYFMWRQYPAAMKNIYASVRANTYNVANWESITGLRIATIQTEFDSAFKSWCANPTIYDTTTYTCPPQTDSESSCTVYGFGFGSDGAVPYNAADPNNCAQHTSCRVCQAVAGSQCSWGADSTGKASCQPISANPTFATCSASENLATTDIALNKPATDTRAVDGDDSTFWYSTKSPAVWTVDLLSNFNLDSIYIAWRYPSASRIISVSTEIPFNTNVPPADSTFTTIKTESGLSNTLNGNTKVTLNGVKARWLRITLNSHYVSEGELSTVRIYATSTNTPPTSPTVTVPGSPTTVRATGGDAQAVLSFTAPTNNGGAAITRYTATAAPGGRTATGTGTSITVTGLTNGVSYTFTVTATNSAGISAASTASNAVTPAAVVIVDPTPTPSDVDIAINKPSSDKRANDGKDSTFWYTMQSTATWTVDLQSTYTLDSIAILSRYPSANRIISVSNTAPTGRADFPAASTFTTVNTNSNVARVWNADNKISLNGATARFVRITLSRHYVEAELNSVRIYASSKTAAAIVPASPDATADESTNDDTATLDADQLISQRTVDELPPAQDGLWQPRKDNIWTFSSPVPYALGAAGLVSIVILISLGIFVYRRRKRLAAGSHRRALSEQMHASPAELQSVAIDTANLGVTTVIVQ